MASPFGIFNPLLKVTCGVQFPLSTCDDLINITLIKPFQAYSLYSNKSSPSNKCLTEAEVQGRRGVCDVIS